jgi:hypothetical protein
VISEWFILLGNEFGMWLMSVIPPIPAVEGWLGGAAALGAFAGSLGVWVNWVGIGLLVTQVLTLYFASFLIRIVRSVVGHVPFIGGNG